MICSIIVSLYLLANISLTSCSSTIGNDGKGTEVFTKEISNSQVKFISVGGRSIEERFITPAGYQRTAEKPGSFASYLRNLPLKPHGSKVKLFDGGIKENFGVYEAVVDLDIGKKNLHQCADAVMRLRAEYLFERKEYNAIHFNFTNGFTVDYDKWRKGNRIIVNGNNTQWVHKAEPSDSHKSFWKYLETIFTYAGTLSLSKELEPVKIMDIKIGDVFIQGGSPGHAVIVVDMAVRSNTNQQIFLLAQSYMPAQEIQILKNPNNAGLSPWYLVGFTTTLRTPEWTFNLSDLKRFGP